MSRYHATVPMGQAGFIIPGQFPSAAPSIPKTGLVLWLKADAITGLSDGQTIQTWSDSSGAGNNATQATSGLRPQYKTNIVNGKPVVRFDGVDDLLSCSPTASAARTVIAVCRQRTAASATSKTALAGGTDAASTNARFIYSNTTGHATDWVYQATGGAGGFSRIGGPVNNWNVLALVFPSTSACAPSCNGAFAGPTFDPHNDYTTAASLWIGKRASTGGQCDVDFAEIIVYNRAITQAELNAIEDYLGAKYAITISHDLPTRTGLLGWYKADAITGLSDGAAVASWQDSHTSAKTLSQATAGKRPTYRTNQIGGLPVVRFDGIDDALLAPLLITGGTTATVYMVIRETASVLSGRFCAFGRDGQADYAGFGCAIINGQTLSNQNGAYQGNVVQSLIARPATTLAHIHTCLWTGTQNIAYLNGVGATPVANTQAFGGNENLVVGAGYYSNATGSPSAVEFAELLVFNVAHDATMRAAMHAYLGNKYGITVTP